MLETLKPDTKVLVLVGPERGIDHENPVPGDISKKKFYDDMRAAAQVIVAGEGAKGPRTFLILDANTIQVSYRELLCLKIVDNKRFRCDCEST